jgi:flagellar biosynthesis chaperone FliJ
VEEKIGGAILTVLTLLVAWCGRAGILWLRKQAGFREVTQRAEVDRLSAREARIWELAEARIADLEEELERKRTIRLALETSITALQAANDRLRQERDAALDQAFHSRQEQQGDLFVCNLRTKQLEEEIADMLSEISHLREEIERLRARQLPPGFVVDTTADGED